jgi:NADP-dependent 3-hydroxy acid dehydrogenase YdfG
MKHAVITGGSSGLGKVTARRLLDEGFRVTILSHNEEKTRAAAEELKCEYFVVDVSDPIQVQKAFQKADAIDVLINNAGLWVQGPLDENDPARVKQVIEVNATGTILCTQAVIPIMKKQGSGRIINVDSKAGIFAKAERAVYNASKWAVTGFTKAMQEELKPHKIAVTALYPNAINQTNLFAAAGLSREITTGIDPQQVADAIAYICKLPPDISVPEMGIENLNY